MTSGSLEHSLHSAQEAPSSSVQLWESRYEPPSMQLPNPSHSRGVQVRFSVPWLNMQLNPLQVLHGPQTSGAQVTPAETFE